MNYAVNATAANRGQTLKVERAVRAAGGSVVASYAEIGVVIAQSGNASFARALRQDGAVDSVGATRTAAVEATDLTYQASDPLAKGESGKTPNRKPAAPHVETPTTVVADPREGEQWDLHADRRPRGARRSRTATATCSSPCSTRASRATTPTCAPNIDAAASAGCLSGSADRTYAAWQPTTSDHGTHVAGTIAAARNGVGIVGVAPA